MSRPAIWRFLRPDGRIRSFCLLAMWCGLFSMASATLAAAEPTRPVVGSDTPVEIGGTGLTVLAKVDTGAESASLDARNIEFFSKGGEEWVRFDAVGEDGRLLKLSSRLTKTVKIKRSGTKSKARPVITMQLCVGTFMHSAQVNLASRENLLRRMLIGRDFLIAGRFLVDPSRPGSLEPKCAATGRK